MKEYTVKVISDVVCNNLFDKKSVLSENKIKMVFSPVDQFIPEIINTSDEDFILLHISQYAFNTYEITNNFLKSMREILLCLESVIKSTQIKIILNTVNFDYIPVSQVELGLKRRLVSDFDNLLFEFAFKFQSKCIIVDIGSLVSRLGAESNISFRNYGVMRSPYSRLLSKSIAKEYSFHFENYLFPRKKIIFVDADNTLWGGVVGEDGVNGVKIGHEYPGSTFYSFQLSLLRLKSAGVLLALVTKNNLADIQEVFVERDMPLSLSDFVAVKANWERKSENIEQLLQSLNIGVSSSIFVDDNPFEVEEVSRMHTEITALKFDINNFNSFYAEFIKSSHLYAHNITQEDVFKTASYVEEEKRKNSLSKSNSFKDYLRDLSIKTTVHLNDLSLTSRISQLSQKTNQFNLTTNRYSISEVEDFMKTDNVFAFSVKDKFGSMGVVGVVIVVENSIDCFLLSCRAFGREIEHSMISVVLSLLTTYLDDKPNTLANLFASTSVKLKSSKLDKKSIFLSPATVTIPFMLALWNSKFLGSIA